VTAVAFTGVKSSVYRHPAPAGVAGAVSPRHAAEHAPGRSTSMAKILYLDFDGVLHDEHVYFHPRRGIYVETPGRVLFEWMPILERLLLPHPDVRIVLSTSWVRVRSASFVIKNLSPSLQQRVIGTTYQHDEIERNVHSAMPRGMQVTQDMHRRAPTSWFAIDDNNLGWPAWSRDKLIQTNGLRGISDPDIQLAIKAMLERL
jgi:hypothetical protein